MNRWLYSADAASAGVCVRWMPRGRRCRVAG